MFKLFSALVFLICLSATSIAQVATDCQVEGLKGKVKTIQVDHAVLDGKAGKWKELRREQAHSTSWDKEGYEIERIVGATDRPIFKIVSSYNATQKIRTENRYDFPGQGVKGVILDSQGNPIKPPPSSPQTQAPDGAVINEILYNYDSSGNRAENLLYEGRKGTGKLYQRRVYRWEADGKMKEEQWYDGAGKLKFKFAYKYDAQGNEIESLMIEGKNKTTSRTIYSEYQFDSQGNWISRINHEEYVTSYNQRIKTVNKTYRQITYWP